MSSRAKEHEGGFLRATGIRKSYFAGKREIPVLKGVDLSLQRSEVLMICGPSGAGKSTLLHILGLLDPPSEGEILFQSENVIAASSARKAFLRNRRFGFVFQFYHLLPDLNVVENVILPLMVRESAFSWLRKRRAFRERAQDILVKMGLGERLKHRPSQLSGGERQRVAIARALVTEPELLFCDEPTGNLDTKTAGEILEILWKVKEEFSQTLVMVTHNLELARRGTRRLSMIDGKLYHDREPPHVA